MKRKFTLLAVLLCVAAAGIYGFFPNDDRGRAPRNPDQGYNNPTVVSGPQLDNPVVGLNESFEGGTFPPTGWTKANPDGGTGWERQTVGTSPIPGWVGGVITAPTGGGNAVAFNTYTTGGATTNNQWLITPQISNIQSGASLKFWLRFWPSNIYSDTVSIRISTTGNAVANFTTHVATLTFPRNSPDTNWTQHTYDIGSLVPSGSNIYIAFQERVLDNFNDGASVSLDLVEVTKGVTSVSQIGNVVPDRYALSQNYPNPFNPTTKIKFALPKAGLVSLKVYDMLGREVQALVNQQLNAGEFIADFDGANLSSGTYFYRLQVGDFVEIKRMVILK